jgi:hypothetical protein
MAHFHPWLKQFAASPNGSVAALFAVSKTAAMLHTLPHSFPLQSCFPHHALSSGIDVWNSKKTSLLSPFNLSDAPSPVLIV